jgi:hypothetical protein
LEAAKVGVMIPTFNRPDLLRSSVLQLASQSRPPDVICVFQNGNPQSYQWAVEDLRTASRLIWMHTRQRVRQHDWYAVPLRQLLDLECTHFFWADDDDLYLHDHVASGLADLKDHDFSVSRRCGLLFTRARRFGYQHEVEFTSHAPGGMSSTMCFNRAFAQELLQDISADNSGRYTDSVLATVTMPKFRCHLSSRRTSIYHAHDGSMTSQTWVEKAFEIR